eukprot:224219-Amphidinium_carterae.1
MVTKLFFCFACAESRDAKVDGSLYVRGRSKAFANAVDYVSHNAVRMDDHGDPGFASAKSINDSLQNYLD